MSKQEIISSLSQIPGVSDTAARTLYNAGARSKSDLRKPELYQLLSREAKFNVRYKIARRITKQQMQQLNRALSNIHPRLILVGSGRRGVAVSRDIDFLTTGDLSDVVDKIEDNTKIDLIGVLNCGEMRCSIIVKMGTKMFKVDLFKTTRQNMPFALLHLTGSRDFNIRTRAQAKRLGYKLSQYGLFSIETGRRVPNLTTERDILKKIKVTYIGPADR